MRLKLTDNSYALLAYLNKEDGFEKVRNVLENAQKSNFPVLMNELNVGEPIMFSIESAVMSKPNIFWTMFWQGYPFL